MESSDRGNALLFSQIKTFIYELSMRMLDKGIPLEDIQAMDVEFYLEILEYQQEKDDMQTESKFDSLGL